MNIKEVEYIVKIAEEWNVTRATERLFITPSALNQQLIHLEKEIGTPLFFRARSGWTPTEAGEVYLEAARAQTILDMVEARMCCGVVSANYASRNYPGIAFFCLPGHPTWNIAASYKKGSYLNKPARFFIQLATDYWRS